MTTLLLRPLLLTALAVATTLPCGHLPAQAATFRTYAKSCGRSLGDLSVTGLPKIGSTFAVDGIRLPYGCTYQDCGCTVGPCKKCSGAVLVLGARPIQVLLPGGCYLWVRPDIILAGDLYGRVSLSVPNSATVLGTKFYMQRIDVSVQQHIDASCAKSYEPKGFNGFSNAVEGTIGQ